MSKNQVKKAILTANIVSMILMILKGVTGVLTGSLAVLASALDSLLDFFVSLFNLYILKKSESPHDDLYNYGHGKIQGIGALLEGGIVAFSGGLLVYYAILKIISGQGIVGLDLSVWVMVVSSGITFGLVYSLRRIAKNHPHLTLRSEILHYQTDLWTNLGIVTSLIAIQVSGWETLDAIITLLIGGYIIFSCQEIVKEGWEMLMDKRISQELLEQIIEIITNTDTRVTGYHFLKSRKSGESVFIEFHLVFDKEIRLLDAHAIGDKIEYRIMQIIPEASIFIHLDPYDDSNRELCPLNNAHK